MASPNVVEFTDANFDAEVISSDKPVLVDFWAEWCMPCRMLTPVIEQLAQDYSGKVKVGKLDTENNQMVAIRFQIQAIPTVILFKGGEMKRKFVGLQSKGDFATALEDLLKD